MNLIFLYGPPAAGKLTIANELSKKTGYPVFQNHTFVGTIADIFPFDDRTAQTARQRLSFKFRVEIFSTAAKLNLSLITTMGNAGSIHFNFLNMVKEEVEKNGGKVYFVQIKPSAERLMQRVKDKSRKGKKIDSPEKLNKILHESPEMFDKLPGKEHLTVDNSDLSPSETAELILNYYKL